MCLCTKYACYNLFLVFFLIAPLWNTHTHCPVCQICRLMDLILPCWSVIYWSRVWILSCSSPWLVALPRLKVQFAYSLGHSDGEKKCIGVFPKGISTKWMWQNWLQFELGLLILMNIHCFLQFRFKNHPRNTMHTCRHNQQNSWHWLLKAKNAQKTLDNLCSTSIWKLKKMT